MDRPAPPPGPYVVAGIGRAGLAAVRCLVAREGSESTVATDSSRGSAVRRTRRRLREHGVPVLIGSDPPIEWGTRGARSLVKSPGIPLDAPLIRRARDAGAAVIDELELGWRLCTAPMVGVTGTNGKSTVSGLVAALLRAAGYTAPLAGNADAGRPLSEVAGEHADWIVCEVSSYQLEASPAFLPEIAVFTNLTPDHLNRHATMRHYGALKSRLVVRDRGVAPTAVIDVDDGFGRRLAGVAHQRGARVLRVGSTRDAAYRIERARWDLRGGTVRIATPRGPVELETPLPGRYNARNLAAALAVADVIGIERETVTDVIARYGGPPGRFERVDEGQPFSVIVDYAESVDAVTQLLTTVRAALGGGAALRVVLGAGGRGDRITREATGGSARRLADDLVLTTGRMADELRAADLVHVFAGASRARGAALELAPARRDAIARALHRARRGDAVVILGSGQLARVAPRPEEVPDVAVAAEWLRAHAQ